ncbi:hypothetical protein KUF83_30070 [Streptomyces sp. BV286]|uniref:hypothetical protein n=1 Tax=Streptomyces sp. BV286 TaxID=2849672 RepID=UPI001C2E2F1B|nr:hypothetical protein [Streptomyces sp. BV286]MBV1940783.1 hypothetical protein [Streptomyces sp. BV286]
MSARDLEEAEEQSRAVRGRKAPLTLVPDWVTLHQELDPQAKAVYNVLAMHVNVERGDDECWPSRKTIAGILGFNREQSVDKYLDQLDAADAIDREDMTRPNGAKGVLYIIHQTPPPGYKGITNISDYHSQRRTALAAQGTRKPGRPRKALTAAAAVQTPPTPAKTAASKSGPAKKKATGKAKPAAEKTPEQIALEKEAQQGADAWWKKAALLVDQNEMGPLMGSARQKSGYFLNLRTKIKEALEAGYTKEVVWSALLKTREWSPAKREFDRALRDVTGVRKPGRGGRAPLFTNDQWKQQQTEQAPATSAAPDLSAFGVRSRDTA